jgi:hypothetical protein
LSSFFERTSDGLIGNGLYGPAVGVIDVSLEQDASVKQLARVSPAEPEEPFDLLALFIGESNDIFLVHGENPRWLGANKGTCTYSLLNQSMIED